MKRDKETNKENPEGTFPDVRGGKPLEPVFSKVLRSEMTRLRKFRKPDGEVLQLSYLQLLVQKIANELLQSPEMDVKLLEMVLNRLEGKVPDSVNFEGGLELRRGLSAKELILSKLDRTVRPKASEESD